MNYRHVLTVISIFAILFLPYWIYIPLIALGIIIFPFYWEALLAALFADALYGAGPIIFSSLGVLALGTLIAMIPLRERLRIHV